MFRLLIVGHNTEKKVFTKFIIIKYTKKDSAFDFSLH